MSIIYDIRRNRVGLTLMFLRPCGLSSDRFYIVLSLPPSVARSGVQKAGQGEKKSGQKLLNWDIKIHKTL